VAEIFFKDFQTFTCGNHHTRNGPCKAWSKIRQWWSMLKWSDTNKTIGNFK